MLHIVTEVGKPGRTEREKRHFVTHNIRSEPSYKPRGRRYIPHGYGDEHEFNPHPPYQEPEYTECGPDWKSRTRRVPSPHNPKAPVEIWPDKWRSMRTFPWMSQRTKEEWTLYPEGYDVTLRCSWDGNHKATRTSSNEVTHTMLYGKGRIVVDKRNGIGQASAGDKNYQVVEYSPSFHKLGCTLPIVNFGGNQKHRADTFVPLQPLPLVPTENFVTKERYRLHQVEVDDVQALEKWRPATPLLQTLPPSQDTDSVAGGGMGKRLSSVLSIMKQAA